VAIFDAVIDAYRATRGVIVVPQIAGDTGHPAIFDLRLRDEILGLDEAQGLRSVTYAHRAEIVRVAVDDVGVLDDMDTPDDYARLR
jgi:molybdenum cofactor cytidylyltransferase